MENFDAIVVGGGPAGSTCAWLLKRAGLDVLILDAAVFPRTKLCAGWVSPPLWDLLELEPKLYPKNIWEWNRCHIHADGQHFVEEIHGFFVRRSEFDAFLLERSAATVVQGHRVRSLTRDAAGAWIVDGKFRCSYLVGAGGTHCPVARSLFPKKPQPAVATQELECPVDYKVLQSTRIGEDGEPELLLYSDQFGYAWNIAKTQWLNIGCGTQHAKNVLKAWQQSEKFFRDRGHLPTPELLGKIKGHSYYLFDPAHLEHCELDSALLIGDALGLAHPFTAEGIVPAVLSARLCAQAIIEGDPTGYRPRLLAAPLLADYRRYHFLRQLAERLDGNGNNSWISRQPAVQGLTRKLKVKIFSWMFSGQAVPGQILRDALDKMGYSSAFL